MAGWATTNAPPQARLRRRLLRCLQRSGCIASLAVHMLASATSPTIVHRRSRRAMVPVIARPCEVAAERYPHTSRLRANDRAQARDRSPSTEHPHRTTSRAAEQSRKHGASKSMSERRAVAEHRMTNIIARGHMESSRHDFAHLVISSASSRRRRIEALLCAMVGSAGAACSVWAQSNAHQPDQVHHTEIRKYRRRLA